MVFKSMYGHQIDWANVYAINLDVSISGLLEDSLIYLIYYPHKSE